MRIAMLGWEFPPFFSGGLGIHCLELTKALAGKGVEVDFYMPKISDPVTVDWMRVIQVGYPAFGEGIRITPYGNIKQRLTATPGKLSPNFFEAVEEYNALAAQYLAKNHAKNPYGLIHCHDWMTMMAGVEAKKITGLPLIVFVHSTEYDRTANLSPFQWIVDIEKRGMHAADLVMTNSNMMKRQLVDKYGVDEKKIRVVYNAVDAGKFELTTVSGKQVLGFAGKTVLFHGRLCIQKGPDFFLLTAKKVLEKEPEARFVIGGKGDFTPKLVEMTIDLGIEDRVLFTGYVPDEKLPLLYSASDVFVLPSISEPFGITVLEAMAAGVPVVVSKTTGASETLNYCLAVDFWDVDEMANKIIALLRYRDLHEVMTEGGRMEVKRFSWSKVADETITVYGELRA